MKSWQVILANGCVTVLAVFAAVGLFSPDAPPDRTKEVLDALKAQFDTIQAKLSSIEKDIQAQKGQVSIPPAPNQPTQNPEALDKLNQKLDMILGKLSVLENKPAASQAPPQSFGRSFGPGPMIPRQLPPSFSVKRQDPSKGPTTWIDGLPEDKKREVEIIFEEHLQRMRNNLPPPDPDGRAPDRETIIRVLKEHDLLLKEGLREILTEKEYQEFLDSHQEPSMQSPRLPATRVNP